MIGESERLAATKIDQVKEAVEAAAETVRDATQSIANAIDAGHRRGALLDRVARWARDVPLHALVTAFLIGALVGRGRR
jgi:hypothetical protein